MGKKNSLTGPVITVSFEKRAPGRGDCVVFSDMVPPPPRCINVYRWLLVPANFMLVINPAMDERPTQGGEKYSQSPHATETGMSSGLMSHVARMQI